MMNEAQSNNYCHWIISSSNNWNYQFFINWV